MSKVLELDHGLGWIGVALIGLLLCIVGSAFIVASLIGIAWTICASLIDTIDHAISQTIDLVRRKLG